MAQPTQAQLMRQKPTSDSHRFTPALDQIVARVKKQDNTNEYEPLRVFNITPLGIDLVQPRDPLTRYSKGDRLDVQLVIEGKRSEFIGFVTMNGQSDESLPALCGIRLLVEEIETGAKPSGNRQTMRWVCSEYHFPKAIAPSPGKFNEFVSFQIRNISESGLMLATDIQNSFLAPKMELTLSVTLPMVGDTVLPCEIVWMRIGTDGARDIIELGVKLASLSPKIRLYLGQFLAQFAQDVSLTELVRNGLSPNNMIHGIQFQSVKSSRDYCSFLSLRESKTTDTGQVLRVSDEDRFCRLIFGTFNRKALAGARVAYPELRDRLKCEDHITWSDSLPSPSQLIEVDDLLIQQPPPHSDKLLLALLRYICSACTNEKRQYVLIHTANPKLLEKAGWQRIGFVGQNSVMLGNAFNAIRNAKTSPIKWNFVWRGSADYLMNSGTIQPKGTDALILKTYQALGPITNLIHRVQYRLNGLDR